ncbi:MAG: hypothetical protein QM689_03285 [Oscillospiraceae bacterium]
MKTGTNPMISKLKLFFKWGFSFEEPYQLPDKGARAVSYINREKLMKAVDLKYPQKKKMPDESDFEEEFEMETEEYEPHKKAQHIRIPDDSRG